MSVELCNALCRQSLPELRDGSGSFTDPKENTEAQLSVLMFLRPWYSWIKSPKYFFYFSAASAAVLM